MRQITFDGCAQLRQALEEAKHHHTDAEGRLPQHYWEDWYAAFIWERRSGMDIAMAARLADDYVRNLLAS